jgi:hypothetical protein
MVGGATPGPLVQQWASYSKQRWGATPCLKDCRALGSDQTHYRSSPDYSAHVGGCGLRY